MTNHKTGTQEQQANETTVEQGREDVRAVAGDGIPDQRDGKRPGQIADEPLDEGHDQPTTSEREIEKKPTAKPAGVDVDLSRLRLSQNFATTAGTKKLIVAVKIRRPNKHDFIRVRPGNEWQFSSALLEHDRETYIVHDSLWDLLQTEISPAVLKLAITRQGDVFLWPLKLPGPDGRDDHWSMSRRAAAEHAEKQWVRVVANMDAGMYDVHAAVSELDGPVWPDEGLATILRLAFKNHVIDSADHPVIKKLRGEL
jgi:hypothetical protein